jgi:Uma2 family endonuclease
VPAYRTIDTVREILLIDSESIHAEILRRDGDRWITELVQRRDSVLGLSSIGVQIPMAHLYEGIDVHSEDEA